MCFSPSDRELAYQIADQFKVFGRHIGLNDVVVVGGVGEMGPCDYLSCSFLLQSFVDMMKQSIALARKPHIVIATPGRLADHLKSTDTFSLKQIRFLVLDEADRLLEPSFEEDLTEIFEALPEKRQTLLFSATLTDSLVRLKKLAKKEPFCWEAPRELVQLGCSV